MKRAVVYIAFILITVTGYGQIDIKYIHSENGKSWKRLVRVDGENAPVSLQDDIITFFSNGTFNYEHSGTTGRELNNSKTKTWSYDKETSIIRWEFSTSSGGVKKYSGEITYLDQQRIVMNFSEEGKEPHIAVFTAH
jgi:hypothetical protein